MQQRPSLPRALATAALLASIALPVPGAAQAQTSAGINFRYWGGPLIQHVKVATLFWGPYWGSAPVEVSYFNNFFQALFADGRYFANLAQYSAGDYTISNGTWGGSDVDSAALPNARQVTDAQIRAEIQAQVTAGKLPAPDGDTTYSVFTPPGVVIIDRDGTTSRYFAGYHHAWQDAQNRTYTYSLIVGYTDPDPMGGPALMEHGQMTVTASHELAEVVTDPMDDTLSWLDERYGEVADIIDDLYADLDYAFDVLIGPDGKHYWVEKVWSNKDHGPVAFAQ